MGFLNNKLGIASNLKTGYKRSKSRASEEVNGNNEEELESRSQCENDN